MITKEKLLETLDSLNIQLTHKEQIIEKAIADKYAIQGAIQQCEFFIRDIDEKNKELEDMVEGSIKE